MSKKFNYTLIVSQYYHSRHCFIVKHDSETFLEKAKAFTAELEKYKRRGERQERAPEYGDLTYHKEDTIYGRYNVNDQGDIYFINSEYANRLMYEVVEYHETSRRESRGYQPKAVTERISEHHNFGKVKEMLEKYFVLA